MKQLCLCSIVLILLLQPPFLHAEKPKAAIVGAGGAGMTTAWLLEKNYDITLYEQADYLGGHINTIEVIVDGEPVTIDAGVEFLSDYMYPTFNKLLKALRVSTRRFPLVYTFYRTDGSNSIVLPPVDEDRISWQTFSPGNLIDLIQINHVVNKAKKLVEKRDTSITLQQFADSLCITESFKYDFLYPFLAGGWGFSLETFEQFAAYGVMKYAVMNKPSGLFPSYWEEIIGGSSAYIKNLTAQLDNTQIKLNAKIIKITKDQNQFTILDDDGSEQTFDYLIIATNAFQAAELLQDIPETADIRESLNKMEFIHATLAIHGDERFMPRNKKDWSVANIRYDGVNSAMTFYKHWRKSPRPVFRSWITFDIRPLDLPGGPLPDPLYATVQYWHPQINLQYFETQKHVKQVNGRGNIWFAGLYTEDADAHESAIISAVHIGEALAPNSERLKMLK